METLLSLWSAFSIVTALVVFLVYMVVDGLYAFYTVSVTEKKALKPATAGALIHLLLAFGVLTYVENSLYIIPLALGSWVGTYVVVLKSSLIKHAV